MIPVSFSPEQVVNEDMGASPSARKPALVIGSWRDRGFPIEVIPTTPATAADFYRAHDPEFVQGVLACRIANGFGNYHPSVAASLPWTSGSMLSAARRLIQTGGPVAVSPTSGFHHASYGTAEGFSRTIPMNLAALRSLRTLEANRYGYNARVLHLAYGLVRGRALDRIESPNSNPYTFPGTSTILGHVKFAYRPLAEGQTPAEYEAEKAAFFQKTEADINAWTRQLRMNWLRLEAQRRAKNAQKSSIVRTHISRPAHLAGCVMETVHWTCQCGHQGSGFIPDECPTCGHYLDATLTEAGFRATIAAHQALTERAEHVARLVGHGCDSIQFDARDTFQTTWESANCGRGCCGYSTHQEDIPLRYLWMSDADIKAEVAAKEAAAKAEEAEKKRKQAISDAEQAAEWARIKAATAHTDAQKALAAAEANLVALRGAS